VVFGVLPIGLFYHAAYTAAISLLMWSLVKVAWPGHLDDDDTEPAGVRSGSGPSGRKTPPAASSAASRASSSSEGASR
jgi:hypothetical protein